MGDVVSLNKAYLDLHSDAGHQFVVDCTRAGESLISDGDLTEKYELSPADWDAIRSDKALGRAVRAERERRMLTGVAARESAARYFIKGPGILDQIATAADSNDRHKIDAIRELRATAAVGGTDRPRESERFVIRIDLTAGGGSEVIEKTITIDATNGDQHDADGQW